MHATIAPPIDIAAGVLAAAGRNLLRKPDAPPPCHHPAASLLLYRRRTLADGPDGPNAFLTSRIPVTLTDSKTGILSANELNRLVLNTMLPFVT